MRYTITDLSFEELQQVIDLFEKPIKVDTKPDKVKKVAPPVEPPAPPTPPAPVAPVAPPAEPEILNLDEVRKGLITILMDGDMTFAEMNEILATLGAPSGVYGLPDQQDVLKLIKDKFL